MSNYESDSDSDESISGKTNVLLGYPDEVADATATALDTRIGGQSIWLNPGSPASSELARCKSCGNCMNLLLQAYAALEETLYERVIYLYACTNPPCRRKPGTARAIRGVLIDKEKMQIVAEKKKEQEKRKKKAEVPRGDLGNMIFGAGFGDDSNPFAAPSSNAPADVTEQEVAEISDSLRAVTIQKYEPWPEDIPKFKSWFLYVENEYLTNKASRDITQRVEVLESTSEGPDEWSAMPESSDSVDQVFQKFADTVANNPEQVVRYDRKGAPLLYTKYDHVGRLLNNSGTFDAGLIPKCPACGSSRVFEFQLMPYAIQVLEEGSGMDMMNGMEWGTIIVATCNNDCTPGLDQNGVGYQEEWVGVQWEESK